MSILVDENTRLLVQGITGREGSFHTRRCMEYGANVVAGVTPGRGGTAFDETVPVFNTVEQAVAETGADASVIFVPPPFAADAIAEAADAGISVIACITEGIPVLDTVRVVRYLKHKSVTLIGPNCPGVISPGGRFKMGIMPGDIHTPGRIGVVSRSGTLTYEAVDQLTNLGIGQSTCVGIGGDPVTGTSFVDILRLFQEDPDTDGVVMIGEIGGTKEQEAAEYIESDFTKPVVALIVGRSAPPGKRMGHAGAIITGSAARADEKVRALTAAGVAIAPSPGAIGSTVQQATEEWGVQMGEAPLPRV
jgi:succinyl-CoA synthetase alpha subunit